MIVTTWTTVTPRIIVFEGLDRSGKSVLRKAFGVATRERYITLARFIFSNLAYDIIFRRAGADRLSIVDYWRAVYALEKDFGMLTIFVDTDPELCFIRAQSESVGRYTVEELRYHREVFLRLMMWAPSGTGAREDKNPRLILETAGQHVSRLVTRCLEWVDTQEKLQ